MSLVSSDQQSHPEAIGICRFEDRQAGADAKAVSEARWRTTNRATPVPSAFIRSTGPTAVVGANASDSASRADSTEARRGPASS